MEINSLLFGSQTLHFFNNFVAGGKKAKTCRKFLLGEEIEGMTKPVRLVVLKRLSITLVHQPAMVGETTFGLVTTTIVGESTTTTGRLTLFFVPPKW